MNPAQKFLVKGVIIARDILSQPAMKAYLGEEEVPGPSVKTDADIRRFIIEKMETVYHIAITSTIREDIMAKVDSLPKGARESTRS